MNSIYDRPKNLEEHFFSFEEYYDLISLLESFRRSGAISAGVFGSRYIPNGRSENSDIDILVITNGTGVWGEVESFYGDSSGTHFHIFFKRPGFVEGNNRRAEILNDAEREYVRYF